MKFFGSLCLLSCVFYSPVAASPQKTEEGPVRLAYFSAVVASDSSLASSVAEWRRARKITQKLHRAFRSIPTEQRLAVEQAKADLETQTGLSINPRMVGTGGREARLGEADKAFVQIVDFLQKRHPEAYSIILATIRENYREADNVL